MPLKKNDIITIDVDSISSDGSGVGHYNGQAVFVPNAAIGDVLQVCIVKAAKTYAYAKIISIISEGPGRVIPDCPVSTKCGGCQFRHINYGAELIAKHSFVKDALKRIGGINTQVLPVLPSPITSRYRNKVQYPVAQAAGGMAFGFYASHSHRLVPCEDCLLQPEIMNRIAAFTVHTLNENGIPAYNEAEQKGIVRHILLRQSEQNKEILLCIVTTNTQMAKLKPFAEKTAEKFPEVTSVRNNINRNNTNVILGETSHTIYGKDAISDILCGVPMRLNEHTFAQVNSHAAKMLFEKALEFLAPTPDDDVLDLYCGTGVIGLSMASKCKTLTGVEINQNAIDSAKQSSEKMGLKNTKFICADAEMAAAHLLQTGTKPSIVIVDPPRKGAGEKTLAAIVKMAPKRILMISCNAATLARDLAYLTTNSYHLLTVQPADLFARTRHVECLCILENIDK